MVSEADGYTEGDAKVMPGVRPRHSSVRPVSEPITTSPTGMDFEKRQVLITPWTLLYSQINFAGDFDGGDLGEPTDLNDYLRIPFDGGVL